MKTIKQTLFAFTALAMLAATTQSCKKTVTPKKLDGEWEMTSGSMKSSSTYSNGDTEVETTTYDGANETTLVSENGVPLAASPSTPYTMSVSFDKKAGTYKQITVSTSTYTNSVSTYKKDSNGNPTDYKTLDQKVVRVSTTTDDGLFTITGGTGEIEKNSQFVLRGNDSESNVKYTYTYFDGSSSVDRTGRYTTTFTGDEEELKGEENEIIVSTGHNDYAGTIYTVDELKKGEMQISGSSASTTTVGANTTKQSIDFNWVLSEVK